MTYFITIAGRRWPAEETFKTGKDVLGWDQCQARTWDAICRHTALSALAQLRQAAIRNALCGLIDLPPAPAAAATGTSHAGADIDHADLRIPLGDAPVPAYPGQPRPRRLALIRLSVAETARLARLAADWAAGLLTPAQLAFRLRVRPAQAAPGRRPVAPPCRPPGRGNLNRGGRMEVTACNRDPGTNAPRYVIPGTHLVKP